MSSKRAFFIMLGLLGLVAISLIAVTVLGKGMLKSESDKLVALKVESQVLERQQTALIKAKQDIAKYSNLEEITQTIVPQDKDQARAVRELVTLARESGFDLKSLQFESSNLGNRVTTPEGAATRPTISQVKPVPGIKGVYSMEISIEPAKTVNYYQFIDFLARLEKNRRTAQIVRITIDPQSTDRRNPRIDFSLNVNIFVKP